MLKVVNEDLCQRSKSACNSACADDAESASKECDSCENNCNDTEYETCGCDTCGKIVLTKALTAGNSKAETYDSYRKSDEREPTAKNTENDTYDSKDQSCYSFSLSHFVPLSEILL